MATEAELAEHGIAGSADVLPMPMGPQMPDFPPPPRTELENLHAERARLQGLLAEAVADAHRARRERDDMRERVSEPYGCTHCGITKRGHARRWTTGVGMHAWEPPSQGQIAERMKARRTVRLASDCERMRARVAELLAERHSTNEALDDAVQELREREQRDAVVAEFVAKRAEYITAIRNCHPDNGHDYDRWQGHAAARRQLAELLGLPVAWPPEDGASVAKSADKLAALLAPSQALREDEPAEERLLGEDELRRAVRGHLFGGGV